VRPIASVTVHRKTPVRVSPAADKVAAVNEAVAVDPLLIVKVPPESCDQL
jgi:hypothetical protein